MLGLVREAPGRRQMIEGHLITNDFIQAYRARLLWYFTMIFFSWWRHPMEIFSALLALCAGNSPVTGELPTQRPVTRSFDVSFGLRLNKQLNKQSWGWWFATLSRSLWRHCNVSLGPSVCWQHYNETRHVIWLGSEWIKHIWDKTYCNQTPPWKYSRGILINLATHSHDQVVGKLVIRGARYRCTEIASAALQNISDGNIQGLYSLSDKTSYRQVSWSLEAARLDFIMIVSLWNFDMHCIWAVRLWRCLSIFNTVGKV